MVRDLTRRRYRVIGVELSSTLIGHASADPGGPTCVQMRRVFRSPMPPSIWWSLSIPDGHRMSAAVHDVARVLRPKGRLCVSITHPIAGAGAFTRWDPEAAFVIRGSYLEDGSRADLRARWACR
jgi:hypothetical protein